MKSIETLKQDMEHVVTTGEGWTNEISEWVATQVESVLNRQYDRGTGSKGSLRLSSIGTPCDRKFWYSTRRGIETEPLPASTRNKFIFGDLTEAYLLGIVKASGHSLEGLQTELVVDGVKGHRDCIIDGMLFDVKSTSSQSFSKFKEGRIRDDDPFGYVSQISSYLYASQDDPLLKEKSRAGFLAFDKQHGHIAVDIYDFSEELKLKRAEIQSRIKLSQSQVPPKRTYEEVPHQKSGNMQIPTPCRYCDYKNHCWDNLRKFIYESGPVWLSKTVKEPKVFEAV